MGVADATLDRWDEAYPRVIILRHLIPRTIEATAAGPMSSRSQRAFYRKGGSKNSEP